MSNAKITNAGWVCILVAALLALGTATAHSQTLYPFREASFPAMDQPNVDRQKGRMGMIYQFQFLPAGDFITITAGIDLDLSGATCSVKIGADPKIAGTATDSPSDGAVGYQVYDTDNDGTNDAIEVFYNGDFPASTAIEVEVAGAQATVAGYSGTFTQDVGSPNILEFTTGASVTRNPVSAELVFDISGSMDWYIQPGGTIKRLQILKSAANVLYDHIGGGGLLSRYGMLGDQLGIVYFSSTATVYDANPPTPNLEPAHLTDPLYQIFNNLNSQVPTYSTSIGAGLEAASVSGFGYAAPGNDKVAILFSDGEQNISPMAEVTGGVLKVGGTNYPADVKVYTITAGLQTAPGFALQQSIANATGADYAHVPDGQEELSVPSLETFFAQIYGDVVVGDKVEMAYDTVGAIVRGTNLEAGFLANPNDLMAHIVVSWTPIPYDTGQYFLPFRLTAPDGTDINLTGNTRFGKNISYTTLHFPLRQDGNVIDQAGRWKIELLGVEMNARRLVYHIMVMLDNSTIASEFDIVGGGDIGTGEPIPVQVALTDGGVPVSGASVRCRLMGPDEGLGDILSDNPNPTGDPISSGDSLRSAAQKNLLLLNQDPATAALVAPQPLPGLALHDNGLAADGDAVAGDGIYSAIMPGAEEEGHYHFDVKVRGNTPENGEYHRSRRLTAFARPKPDPDSSEIYEISDAMQADGSRLIRVGIKPKDSRGNRLGPDYYPHLSFACPTCSDSADMADNLDGSYAITYRVPAGVADPVISVSVMGEPVSEFLPQVVGGFSRWVISAHGGYTLPMSPLSNWYDGSLAVAGDLEYRFDPRFSAELMVGHDRFTYKWQGDDFHLTNISGYAKYTFTPGIVRPTAQIGGGAYFAKGGDTYFGWSAIAGVQYWHQPRMGFEISYGYTNVDGGDVEYSTVKAGVRFAIR